MGRSGQVRKISLPSGSDPRTTQPLASRYTDYATRPTYVYIYIYIYIHVYVPIPEAASFKVWVCGHSLAGIVGSNTAGSMNMSLGSVVFCQVEIHASG